MDDLISRSAAIDEVKRLHDVAWANWKETRISTNTMIDALKDLPAAQPERKKGRWILDRSGSYSCSECMEPCATYVMMKPRDKFCKMCGAEMQT